MEEMQEKSNKATNEADKLCGAFMCRREKIQGIIAVLIFHENWYV